MNSQTTRTLLGTSFLSQSSYALHVLLAFWLFANGESFFMAAMLPAASYLFVILGRFGARQLTLHTKKQHHLVWAISTIVSMDLLLALALAYRWSTWILVLACGFRWSAALLIKSLVNRYVNELPLSTEEKKQLNVWNIFTGNGVALVFAVPFLFTSSIWPTMAIEGVSCLFCIVGLLILRRVAPEVHALEGFSNTIAGDLKLIFKDAKTRRRFVFFLFSQAIFLGLDWAIFIYVPVTRFPHISGAVGYTLISLCLAVTIASALVAFLPSLAASLCRGMLRQQFIIVVSLICFWGASSTQNFSLFLGFYFIWNIVREILWLETDFQFSTPMKVSQISTYVSILYSFNGLFVAATILSFVGLIEFLGFSEAVLVFTSFAFAFGSGSAIALGVNQLFPAEVPVEKEKVRQLVHDIQSPLVTIDLVVNNAQGLNAKEKELISAATKQLSSLGQSAITTEIKKTPVHVQPILEEVIASKQKEFSSLNVVFNFTATALRVVVNGDGTEFRRVFSNLINNAVEAYATEAPEKTVNISLSTQNNIVVFTIEDFGKGIPKESIRRVFENGFTEGKPGGSGLGLFSAKSIIEHFNGRIGIESVVGKGTRVQIFLPRSKA